MQSKQNLFYVLHGNVYSTKTMCPICPELAMLVLWQH